MASESTGWQAERPQLRLFPLIVSWVAAGVAFIVAAGILPGVWIDGFWGALLVAAVVAVLNAFIPPVLAALRLPATLVLGFLLVLFADAGILLLTDALTDGVLRVDGFGWALLTALVVAAVSVVLAVLLGTDDMSAIRIAQRIARRQGIIAKTDLPGIVFLEIDGLALPVLRRAMRDGNAPTMARWLADTHRLAEWETDLSSQTGASQAGILLGSNEDISAFRWVEKATGTMLTCSAPPDCAEIERRRATGIGLLVDGGSSRGNLLSGEAEDVILTVSRMDAEKKSNPGYRAFLANGDNVTRTLVLFIFEIVLEWTASLRAIRRDVRPRGHRGGIYPLMRASLCVFVRDLIVSGVLTDMMRGSLPLRDVLQLRRGRAPLGARARRHARGAAQARRPVRADRASQPLRATSVLDRRSFRSRTDAGRDLQAAQRVWPRRAGRALARARRRGEDRRRGRAELDGRPRLQRGDRQAGQAGQERRLTATWSCSAPATSASTEGSADFRPAPSSCTPRTSRHRPNRSSAPPACTASSRAGARRSRPVCPPRCRSRPSGRRRPRPHTRGSGDVTSCGARPAIPGERRRLVPC